MTSPRYSRPRLCPALAIGALTAVLGPLSFGPATVVAQDSDAVQFSAAPAKGLKYKLTLKGDATRSFEIEPDEGETQNLETTSKDVMTYIQTIVDVKDGKITALERRYEDMSSTVTREGTMRRRGGEEDDGGPQERESPLAWKHFRATYGDDGEAAKVEVKEDDEWTEPEGQLKRMIRPETMRRPLFPLPTEEKRVGETWELSDEDAKKWFPRGRGRGRRGGGEESEDDREITTSIEFAEIATHRGMKCAVLKGTFNVARGETSTSTVRMTVHYSLEHKIVVGVRRESKSESERTIDRGRITGTVTSNTKSTAVIQVDIVPASAEDAEG